MSGWLPNLHDSCLPNVILVMLGDHNISFSCLIKSPQQFFSVLYLKAGQGKKEQREESLDTLG